MKLSHACWATQDGQVMVERSDRMWSTGEGNGKPLQYSCLENPINSMKIYVYTYMYIHMKVQVSQSCLTLRPHGLYSLWNSPGQNPGVGSHSLFLRNFPTQGLNPGLLHCRWTLYQLSHQGSPLYTYTHTHTHTHTHTYVYRSCLD